MMGTVFHFIMALVAGALLALYILYLLAS